MINRYDGQGRSLIAITQDDQITVSVDDNGVGLIEGPVEALRGLYETLQDLFYIEETKGD